MSDNTFEDYFVCFELPPPQDSRLEAFSRSLSENPRNAILSSGALPELSDQAGPVETSNNFNTTELGNDSNLVFVEHEPSALALNGGKLWEPGRTLRIRFLEGSTKLQKKVKAQALTWLDYANINFRWVEEGEAEIRIAFKQGGGSWSHVGAECLQIPEPAPTMNFGKLDESSSVEEVRRVVLHEFGHALGCIHEHQSPLSSLQWNTARIYADCAKPPNRWTKGVVDYNILDKTKTDKIRAREFDLDSIMLYSYPAAWLLDGQGTKNNTSLSKEDKAWIGHCYPAYQTKVGVFSTMEVRAWDNPDTSNDYKQVTFAPAYERQPQIITGLTWLDLDCQHDLCITANVSDVTADGCRVNITSERDSRIYTGGCAWLESVDEDYDLQIGEVDVSSMTSLPNKPSPKVLIKRDIKFGASFADRKPPNVVVWFKSLGFSKDHNWDVKVSARNAYVGGFELIIEIGNDTVLQGAKVSWLAYPASRDDIVSGVVSVPQSSNTSSKQLPNENSGVAMFPDGAFSEIPQTLFAISGVNFEKGHNLRLRLSQSALSTTGFAWHIDNWLDSIMFGASMSWLAMKPSVNRSWNE